MLEFREEAKDATKLNIRKLCFDGPQEELTKTANQQPCILTVTAAVWSIIKSETDFFPDFYAGHSLGEYSALVAAEKLSLSKAASLVYQRGLAMQKAVPEGQGAMAAILNFTVEQLVELCTLVADQLSQCVEIVNFNSPQQLIISGHKEAVNLVCQKLEGEDKVRCMSLPVSAPFHSKLMAPAREDMTPLLQKTELSQSDYLIIANLTGNIESQYSVEHLIKQIDNPVLWTQTLETAHQEGCQRFVEVGPGKVLFGLARKTLPKGLTLLHTSDIQNTIKELQA
ncbi:MAG: ACP S-malonyltransferase [Bdellovibrionota bacterium]